MKNPIIPTAGPTIVRGRNKRFIRSEPPINRGLGFITVDTTLEPYVPALPPTTGVWTAPFVAGLSHAGKWPATMTLKHVDNPGEILT